MANSLKNADGTLNEEEVCKQYAQLWACNPTRMQEMCVNENTDKDGLMVLMLKDPVGMVDKFIKLCNV